MLLKTIHVCLVTIYIGKYRPGSVGNLGSCSVSVGNMLFTTNRVVYFIDRHIFIHININGMVVNTC
jgi:hypothetical protein